MSHGFNPPPTLFNELRASQHTITNHANTSVESLADKWNNFGEKSSDVKTHDEINKSEGFARIAAEEMYGYHQPGAFGKGYQRKKDGKKACFDTFVESATRNKAKKDPQGQSKLTPVDFARQRLAGFFNLDVFADAVAKNDHLRALRILHNSKLKLTEKDGKKGTLPERLLENTSNNKLLSDAAGGKQTDGDAHAILLHGLENAQERRKGAERMLDDAQDQGVNKIDPFLYSRVGNGLMHTTVNERADLIESQREGKMRTNHPIQRVLEAKLDAYDAVTDTRNNLRNQAATVIQRAFRDHSSRVNAAKTIQSRTSHKA